MTEEKNEVMRRIIIDWGLPECFKENQDNIVFKFDDIDLAETKESGYHCQDGNVKFCLCDKRTGKPLFSMDFYKSESSTTKLLYGHDFVIRLELLYVHNESLRKKGISSFYIEKLKEYAIQEKTDCIIVLANANADNFKNDNKIHSLIQRELEEFYNKRSTPEMPIELLNKKLRN